MRLMQRYGHENTVFDVVDLDSNGSSLAYIDSALGCLSDDGLLAATFTDMNVLCDPAALGLCFSKYGSAPLSEPYILENVTRMLLYTINTLATRQGKTIEPLLALTTDNFIRIFVKVSKSQANCLLAISNYSLIYQCTTCHAHWL